MAVVCPRVLVVDDDEAIRISLRIALREEGYDVRAEEDGRELAKVLDEFRPDVAILDVHLGSGPDGFEMGRQLSHYGRPFLFLSAADHPHDKCYGFDVGAQDYVVKPFVMPELVRRVRAQLRSSGRTVVHQVGDLVVDDLSKTAYRGDKRLDLTNLEYELLFELVRRPGKLMPKAELLRRLWDGEVSDTNAVEARICALRRKLHAVGPPILHTRRNLGYELTH